MKTKESVVKGIWILALAVLTGLSGFAQDKGKMVKQNRPVAEFNAIDIALPVKVMISQADTAKVQVEAPADIQGKVTAVVKNNTLTFDIKGGLEDITLYVVVKNLNSIKVSGPAELKGESIIKSEKLNIGAGGASKSNLELDVTDLITDVSGAAELKLAGKAGTHKSEVSGAASLKAIELQTKKTDIEVSGAGNAKVDAVDELKGEVSGAGNLGYKNKPPVYSVEESGAASSGIADTTKIRFGDKHVMIFNDKHHREFGHRKHNDQDNREGKVRLKVFGVDFGVNSYLDQDHKFGVPAGSSYLEPNYGRSFGLGLDFLNVGIPLQKKHVTLWLGPGFEFNNYYFKNNYHLFSDSTMVNAVVDPGASYEKNKLAVSWFRIPLVMEFNFSQFHFSLGVIGAVRMSSHTKQVWKDGETTYKAKTFDDFYLNPYKADATFRIGFGPVELFGDYTFTGMYRSGHGPKLYPITLGLACSLYSGK